MKVFLTARVSPSKRSINGTNLQNEGKIQPCPTHNWRTSGLSNSYFLKTIEGAILLFWAYFYYRVGRTITAKTPVSFSLLTVLTPLAGLAVIAASTHAMWSLLDNGVNVFLYGGLFGTLIIVLNMCIFYLYTKLSVAHKALIFARDLTHTPPVWTPEQGLSVGFIEKYEKIRIFRRKNFMASVEIDFVVPDVLAAFETYSKVFGTEAVEKSSLERGLNENEVFEKASAAGFSTILEIQEVQMSSLPSGSKTAMQKDPWGYIWTSSNW